MADFVFNIAKGKIAEYVARVNANDPTNSVLLVVPLLAAGLESDAVLRDKDDLAAVFAGTTDEATSGGWNRKVLDQTAGLTVTVDDVNDRVDVDMPDQMWIAVAAGNNVGKLIVAYDSDSTSGTDTNVVPLCAFDFSVTTDGTNPLAQVGAAGFYRAA